MSRECEERVLLAAINKETIMRCSLSVVLLSSCLLALTATSRHELASPYWLSREPTHKRVSSRANPLPRHQQQPLSAGLTASSRTESGRVVHFRGGAFPPADAPVYDLRCQESNVFATKVPVKPFINHLLRLCLSQPCLTLPSPSCK